MLLRGDTGKGDFMARTEIVSSTGGLGTAVRPDGRLYINGTGYVDSPAGFSKHAARAGRIHDRLNTDGQARSVFRGIVAPQVMDHITSNGMRSHLEAALPLREFTGDGSVLVTLARNGDERRPKVPVTDMIQATENHSPDIRPPLARVEEIFAKGYTFSNTLLDSDIDRIQDHLWGEMFGWTRDEVVGLQKRLKAGELIAPENRDVWFSAVRNPQGKIVSISFAERLQRPGPDGKMVDTVESTDWRVHPEYEGNGFMPATLAMLNAQVLNDLANNENFGPIIYAECNFTTRADYAGAATGFGIPDREHAQQVLVRNAVVGGEAQDYTFMYLGKDTINRHYSINDRNAMLIYLNKR
jgi:hypothetical protein